MWSNKAISFWFLQPSCRCQGSSGNWIWHGIDWCQSFNYITQWRIYNDQRWWLVWSHGQWRGSCHAPVWQKSISTAQVSVHTDYLAEMVFWFENCSYQYLLSEKIVLVIEKNFWNLRLKAENLQIFWDHQNNFFKQVKGQNNSW